MKKRGYLYFIVYAVILMMNILIVLSQIGNITVSIFSLPALYLMIVMVIQAVLSYLLRHKGNFLLFRRFGRANPFAADKDSTFNDLYINRFFFMLKIHCLAIPFYIPQIFLTSSYVGTLWALLVFFSPQVVFIIMGIVGTFKDVKENKAKEERLEKERFAQERREELGKWK